jgi:hypothetical protein
MIEMGLRPGRTARKRIARTLGYSVEALFPPEAES